MSNPQDALAVSLTRELERVEARNLEFYQAFSARDVDQMANLWSRSPYARCVHPGCELVVGYHDIRQSWAEIFGTLHSIEFALEDVHVEVSGSSAWVNLVVFVDVVTDDNEMFQASVVTTNIFEQTDGEWMVVLHHSSNFTEEEVEEEQELPFGGRSTSGIDDPN